jgi:hypothetical protein
MQPCLFCQELCPGDEDGCYVCRGTADDSQGPDDPVAHVSCVALALIREPGCWYWWMWPPEPGDDPDRLAAFDHNVALLRSLEPPPPP